MADEQALRQGWTTGACATAAAKAACCALLGDGFPDPVGIDLPGGRTPAFALALAEMGEGWARAGIVKDAGDDPDVTHGATIIATLRHGIAGAGLVFRAGRGVGIVTRPGLPLAVGEPAINPVPRRLMAEAVAAIAARHGMACDLEIEISVPGGEDIALRTWNPRLGILGGISILGTTGVVIPYSCSAWIHSIQRGIDVARACGLIHVAGCVGSTSEKAVRKVRGLGEEAIIDMGDFAGGMLKYLRRHPIPRVTIAGGFAKMCKLAAGQMDLHSSRSQVDMVWLAAQLRSLGADAALVAASAQANTALEVLELAEGFPLGQAIARQARAAAREVLDNPEVSLDVLVVDRQGRVIGDAH
ncbi:cobalt-precorrin-5B (C(1))-methyltransferase [Paramagnetospirillum magneticum]|uniref:Cobalt-precorrin-5B C(1)-methyltransferase n=1 Tax=Paramagnetospirillum magneticum (strain ATCC 700264 / AMB-1) TaxID=342108 RepID=CBID_PARM1|nr:cobalt-precorrin-5B (C(1))-methyltransferase [Paramagnetospirillum magneticum]Q2W3X9.1 RecName: Full=Cobalt-precorrin-5B C(1)-methyltransferase; AltName: Full=Cobalt-precorrin-6A synthase [Paramagnetospirillum magneticum AMB-1]BAE51446.1 Cobalamin biosynthesis protein CbiD [Paramagnetospirillum magneticum AMB-1]